MKFYTYIHIRKDSNKIFYVGKGQGNRAYVTKRNKHWHAIADQYGFDVCIIAYWRLEQEALDHEMLLISCFNDMGYHLANKTSGGEGTSGLTPWNKGLTGPSSLLGGVKKGSKRPGIGGVKKGNVPWNKGVTGIPSPKKGKKYKSLPKIIPACSQPSK
jgi:hypothetical protein